MAWYKRFRISINRYYRASSTIDYLNLALEQYSSDKKRVFNTRGKAFKSMHFDIDSLSREEIIQHLLSDGKLIKRPFLVYEEKKVILGFNEIEYDQQFM